MTILGESSPLDIFNFDWPPDQLILEENIENFNNEIINAKNKTKNNKRVKILSESESTVTSNQLQPNSSLPKIIENVISKSLKDFHQTPDRPLIDNKVKEKFPRFDYEKNEPISDDQNYQASFDNYINEEKESDANEKMTLSNEQDIAINPMQLSKLEIDSPTDQPQNLKAYPRLPEIQPKQAPLLSNPPLTASPTQRLFQNSGYHPISYTNNRKLINTKNNHGRLLENIAARRVGNNHFIRDSTPYYQNRMERTRNSFRVNSNYQNPRKYMINRRKQNIHPNMPNRNIPNIRGRNSQSALAKGVFQSFQSSINGRPKIMQADRRESAYRNQDSEIFNAQSTDLSSLYINHRHQDRPVSSINRIGPYVFRPNNPRVLPGIRQNLRQNSPQSLLSLRNRRKIKPNLRTPLQSDRGSSSFTSLNNRRQYPQTTRYTRHTPPPDFQYPPSAGSIQDIIDYFHRKEKLIKGRQQNRDNRSKNDDLKQKDDYVIGDQNHFIGGNPFGDTLKDIDVDGLDSYGYTNEAKHYDLSDIYEYDYNFFGLDSDNPPNKLNSFNYGLDQKYSNPFSNNLYYNGNKNPENIKDDDKYHTDLYDNYDFIHDYTTHEGNGFNGYDNNKYNYNNYYYYDKNRDRIMFDNKPNKDVIEEEKIDDLKVDATNSNAFNIMMDIYPMNNQDYSSSTISGGEKKENFQTDLTIERNSGDRNKQVELYIPSSSNKFNTGTRGKFYEDDGNNKHEIVLHLNLFSKKPVRNSG